MCSCFSDPTPGALQPNPRRDNHWDFSSVGPVGRRLLAPTVLRGIVTCAPQLEEEKHSYKATGRFKISGPDPPSAASSHWTASESHLETRCLDTSVCYGDGHLEGSKTCVTLRARALENQGKFSRSNTVPWPALDGRHLKEGWVFLFILGSGQVATS